MRIFRYARPFRRFLVAAAVMGLTASTGQASDGLLSSDTEGLAFLSSPTSSFATTIADDAEQTPGLIGGDAAADTVSADDYKALLDRVDELEGSWEKYQDKLSSDADAKKKKPSFKLNGRIHLDNWNFTRSDAGTNFLETGDPADDPENRIDFRRIRLTWTGNVPDHMLFRIMIDFNNPNRPEMKDVYFGFNNLPCNQTLLLGNQKRPLGLDHLNSSRHNVFIERPLIVESFNEDARRTGLCMYGYTDDELYHWRYGAFLLENITGDGRYRGDSTEGGLYARLSSSPWYDHVSNGRGYWHYAIAGSANKTDPDGTTDADDNENEGRFRTRPLARSDSRWWNTGRIPGSNTYQQFALESMLNIGAFQLTGEYMSAWLQRDAAGGFNGDDLHFHGGYLFASYFLTGEHIPLKRTTGTIDRVKPFENFFIVERCRGGTGCGWGALAIALRADYLDLSDSDIRGGDGYAITVGTNWYWTAYSKLQTNYIAGNIKNAGQNEFGGPVPAGVDGDFGILGFRFMIDF